MGLSYQCLDYIEYVYIESLTNAWIGDGWVSRGLQSCCLTACNCGENVFWSIHLWKVADDRCFKNYFWSNVFFLCLSVVGGTKVDFLIAYPAPRWTILPILLSLHSLCENQSRPTVQVHCINLDAQSVYGLSKLSTGKERDVKTKIKCSRNQSPRTFSQSFPI